MFLRNAWYVAGWAGELGPGQSIARRFLGEAVVLYRTQSGELGALEDRCRHRAVPLSLGHVAGEMIRCAYHGMEYDRRGVCTKIPSQDRIPARARVLAYPIVEQDAVIWIWMGQADHADPAAIPRHLVHADPAWGWRSDHFMVNGGWRLLIDNLMDLSHLPYIHPKTIGGDPETHFRAKTETERTSKGVMVRRYMPASPPPPTYVAAKGFTGLIDRWQEIEFEPVLLRIHTGGCDAGTGAYEGRREHGVSMIGFHGITPETETTTHYFWSMTTNVLPMVETIFEQTAMTFREDQAVLEAQQARLDETPDQALIDIASDIGGNLVRRHLNGLMAAERADIAPAA
jgi:vanillate O-demethylase monooxygenase subunit